MNLYKFTSVTEQSIILHTINEKSIPNKVINKPVYS